MESAKSSANWVAVAYKRLGGFTETIRQTGFSPSTLQRWRAAKKIGDTDACFTFAELTGISPWLLAGRPAPGGEGDEQNADVVDVSEAETGQTSPAALAPAGAVAQGTAAPVAGRKKRGGGSSSSSSPYRIFGGEPEPTLIVVGPPERLADVA